MVEVVKGSQELKKSLPYGALKEMAVVFGHSLRWISRVVGGDENGNVKIIECANDLADIEFDKQAEIKKVLDEYTKKDGSIN
jgi:hypothetical protein